MAAQVPIAAKEVSAPSIESNHRAPDRSCETQVPVAEHRRCMLSAPAGNRQHHRNTIYMN